MKEAEVAPAAGEGSGKKGTGLCMRIVGSIWRLKQDKDASANDQELYVKQTFKELLVYAVFLVFICIIAFSMMSTNMYYYTKVMMELFLDTPSGDEEEHPTFREISTVADFWEFASGAFLNGLYWTKWYNNDTEPDFGELIYYENKLLGPPRIRQIRVQTNSCTVNPEFSSFISECYAEYEEAFEDKDDFGRVSNSNDSSEATDALAWKWRPYEILKGKSYWGKLTHYGPGGYALDLTMKRDQTADLLKGLCDALWIRRGSRAVFISFTVYNANINLFCVILLAVEFPATGGAEPSWSFDTVKLIRYVTPKDYIILGCEVVFLIFILYYSIEEIIEISSTGYVYFFDFWNLLDLLLIILSLVCAGINAYRVNYMTQQLLDYQNGPKKHQSFAYIGFLEARFNNCVAGLVFFAWVKIFKYISFNKTMTQLSTTLNRCAKDLLGFLIMFAIVFVAFTQLGYLLFGTQVDDFSTFLNSFFTLFRIILGDFDFHQLEQANRILGPIFFMLFVFFVFFVLINMFLAIINDTYSEVKSDMAKQVDVFIMSDYVKQTANRLMDKLASTKEKMEGIETFLQAESGNKRVSFDSWKTELLKQGYEEDEIEEMFAKFDVDNDRSLDPIEQKKIFEELEKARALLKAKDQQERPQHGPAADPDDDSDEDKKDNVSMDEFNSLSRRVERMEAAMNTIVASIDNVLSQFKLNAR